eukprot:365574-Chlamydomonas_euryale.AAC.3
MHPCGSEIHKAMHASGHACMLVAMHECHTVTRTCTVLQHAAVRALRTVILHEHTPALSRQPPVNRVAQQKHQLGRRRGAIGTCP